MAVAAPTVVVEPENGRTVITVSLPDFATISTFTVYRLNTATGVSRAVRTLVNVEPLGSLTQGFDYELPIGVPVTYTVTVMRSGVAESSPASAAVTWNTTDAWLKDVDQPERSMTVTVVALGQLGYDTPAGVYDVLGRRFPVVISDLQSAATGTLELATLTLDERNALLSLTSTGSVLLFQADASYGVGWTYSGAVYLVPQQLTETRPERIGTRAVRTWSLAFVEVEAPTLGITLSDFTYQSVLDAYATYQAVLDAELTYYDLLTSPGTADTRSATRGAGPEPLTLPAQVWAWPELTTAMRGDG